MREANSSRSRRLVVDAELDLRSNDRDSVNVAREITEFDVAPDGKEIAFIARGEVFVTSTDHGESRRITDTPEQERSISFSPDGRSLLYASERNGSWNLYRTNLADDDEPSFFNATKLEEEPVLEIEAETFQPSFSPDGKEVAYLKERTQLEVVNLESGKRRTILAGDRNYSYRDGDQWYQWSPDGQWFLVQFLSQGRWSSEVGLVASSGEGEVQNLTTSGFEDFRPQWSIDGNAMIWYTDRFGTRQTALWSATFDVQLAFFNEEAWDRYRLSEVELEQLKEREKKAEKDEKKDKKKDDDAKKNDEKGEKKRRTRRKTRKTTGPSCPTRSRSSSTSSRTARRA